MTGITRGSTPITGVYAGSGLATGLYVGNKRIWPFAAPGGFAMGVGAFQLQARGLLAETDQSIRVGPASLAFVGSRLSMIIADTFEAAIPCGALQLQGVAPVTATAVAAAVQASTLALAARGLAATSGQVIPAIAGSLHFAPEALTVSLASGLAIDVTPGALHIAPEVLVSSLGNAFSGDMAAAALHFAASAMTVATGAAVAMDVGAGAIAFSGTALVAVNAQTAAAAIVPSAITFNGVALTAVTAAATAITQVGTPVIFTATSGNLPLPTGCQAGDVLVIANRGAGMPAPSGFATWLPLTAIGTSGRMSAIYAKALTSTDISNGNIAVSSNSNTCTASAWRGVDNTTLTNAIGTLGLTASAIPARMVAPGITTTVNGCMLLFFGFPDVNQSGSGTFTSPTGYTDVADNFTTLRAHTIDSLLQTTHGATGSVTGTYTVSGSWPTGAILIALKPA